MASSESTKALVAALAANLAIAVMKFVAAAFTGSSAMVSEGIHSLVDTGDSVLLLVGRRLSRRPPDEEHPFGHGKEVYVWSLVVAVLIFAVGAGMSVYEGIEHLKHPTEITSAAWSFGVLGGAALFEGFSWVFSYRGMTSIRRGRGLAETIERTADPSTVAVFLEDSAALVGLVVAAAGMGLTLWTKSPAWDGAASIVIGLVLGVVAVVLVKSSRDVLLGQAANPVIVESIRSAARGAPLVRSVGDVLTMHMGPDEILLNISVEFEPGVCSEQLAEAITGLERRIREGHPRVKRIFVEAAAIERGGGSPGLVGHGRLTVHEGSSSHTGPN